MVKIRGLQQRLAVFMFLPVALLLIAMGVAGFVYVRHSLLAQWGEAATLKLQRAAHAVDMRLGAAKAWLKLFHASGDDPNAVYYHDLVIQQLERLEGVARVNLTWTPGSHPHETAKQELGPSLEATVVEITPPRYDSLVNNETISLISDLKAESATTIGRLEVVIRFDYLINTILSAGWGQSDQAYLVDSTGKVLASTRPASRQHLGDSDDPLEFETLRAMQKLPYGTVIGRGFPPANVSGFYRLHEAPWTLIMIAPGKEVLAPIIKFRWYYFISGAIFIFLILTLIRLALGRTVSSIQDISSAAGRVADGEFTTLPSPKTRDEVGQLILSFNTMVRQLEERLSMKEALDLAMKVQQNLLPRQPLKNEYLEITGKSIYCEKTGGDYFDFFPLSGSNGNKIVVAVGDVVGHGIPAALLMTTVRALLRSRMSQPGNLAQSIADVNRLLCMDTAVSCDYMTLFAMVIDSAQKELCWVRAGHEPAIIYDPSSDAVAELYGSGMALGIDSDFRFEEYRRSNFTAGQVIAMGTDGIWETESPQGEKFGRDRFRQTISSHGKHAPQEILQALMQDLSTFRKTAPQHDDITLVVVKAKK